MPSPINELYPLQPTDPSAATPTEASNLKHPNESLEEQLAKSEHLGFLDQARLVREGLRKGFTYDGCTAVPDFNFGHDCCGEHDFHYQAYDMSRAEADKRLRKCIQAKGYIVLPWIYWLGVRIFGGAYYRKKQNETFPLADDNPLP